MANLTLQLESDAMREAISQAILGTLTPEVQAEILNKAVQAVLAPSTNSWDRGKSPLERAFLNAIENVADIKAKELVEKDSEINDRVANLLRSAADKLFRLEDEKLSAVIANAFAQALTAD
jgi:hypothetical protein